MCCTFPIAIVNKTKFHNAQNTWHNLEFVIQMYLYFQFIVIGVVQENTYRFHNIYLNVVYVALGTFTASIVFFDVINMVYFYDWWYSQLSFLSFSAIRNYVWVGFWPTFLCIVYLYFDIFIIWFITWCFTINYVEVVTIIILLSGQMKSKLRRISFNTSFI